MLIGLDLFDVSIMVVLVLNTVWFGLAFRFFTLRPDWTAKGLVARSDHKNALMPTLATSMRFLGGINLALAVFAALLLLERKLFVDPRTWVIFAVVFTIAHASQFYVNLDVLWQGRRTGKPLWPVLKGMMLFIFVIDGALAVANAAVAAVASLKS